MACDGEGPPNPIDRPSLNPYAGAWPDVANPPRDGGAAITQQAAIRTFLIVDVRGYTKFTLEHGDAAAARLASRLAAVTTEIVAAREGTVIELRGDEALAVFASARQALWAAVELQTRCAAELAADPNLPLRIGAGLDAGEAISVEEGGFRGVALNLAARLCSLAAQGEVLASQTVTDLARKVEGLAYADRGAVELKGFSDPVRVYAVRAESAAAESDSVDDVIQRNPEPAGEQRMPIGGFLGALPEGTLVARQAELDQILDAAEAASEGRGQMVLLAGEPGAGKTRLAQEATLELRNRGFVICSGRCYEAEQTIPYYPFLEAIEAAFEAAPAQLQKNALERWPFLGILLPNHAAKQDAAPATSDGMQEQRLFFAAGSFLEAIAADTPVAVLLDDLHWSDPASLKLLLHLARQARSSRVLFLGAYRDVEVNRRHPLGDALRELDRESLVRRIPIRRLDENGTGALIAAIMGEDEISDEFTGLLFDRTEGNPFFIHQVMRVLVDRADVYREGGRWERKAVDAIEVPESVRSVIGQRLQRLTEETQEVLAEASVLGQTFGFDELVGVGERLSNRTEAAVSGAIDAAESFGLVRELSRDAYGFDHALTQQALYSELSSRRRRRLHLAAAEAIEALQDNRRAGRVAQLAYHFLEGDDPPRAALYSVLAGEEAERAFAHDDAEPRFRTAIDLAREVSDPKLEARALSGLGTLLQATGRYAEALEWLKPAAALNRELGDREAEVRVESHIGGCHLRSGNVAEGISRLRAVLDEARERNDPAPGSGALAAATSTLGRLYWATGDLEASLAAVTTAAELARAADEMTVLAEAETRRATILFNLGKIDESNAVGESALDLAEQAGALEIVSTGAINLSISLWISGQFDRAETYLRRAAEASERWGDPNSTAFALHVHTLVCATAGRWDEARDMAERAWRLSEPLPEVRGRPYILFSLAMVNVWQGRWEEATSQLEEAVELTHVTEDSVVLEQLAWLRAWMSILRGHPEEVVKPDDPLFASAGADLFVRQILRERVARATIDLGDPAGGEAAMRDVVAVTRENGSVLVEAWALPTLGRALAKQGRFDEARETLERAIELSRKIHDVPTEAQARVELGYVLADMGENEGAREQFETALAVFRRLGAVPFVEEVQRALANLG